MWAGSFSSGNHRIAVSSFPKWFPWCEVQCSNRSMFLALTRLFISHPEEIREPRTGWRSDKASAKNEEDAPGRVKRNTGARVVPHGCSDFVSESECEMERRATRFPFRSETHFNQLHLKAAGDFNLNSWRRLGWEIPLSVSRLINIHLLDICLESGITLYTWVGGNTY